MKFYETHYEEYIKAVDNLNIHPELNNIYNKKSIYDFNNLIIYGGPGIGKYSQVLKILKNISPSELKYERKITVKTDKQEYQYKMSDIHYEIDMAFLGCNSKVLWHEIYFQIVDIVSVKTDKIGIIVCKNFHKIHSELLENFYSYIQQFNTKITSIQIKFIILTENISFLPSNILNVCQTIGIKRPNRSEYYKLIDSKKYKSIGEQGKTEQGKTEQGKTEQGKTEQGKTEQGKTDLKNDIIDKIAIENIINLKELYSFSLIKRVDELPEDVFNTVCNQIISEIDNYKNHDFFKLREVLYDILVYNLDTTECIYYILSYYIESDRLSKKDISDILTKTYSTLKYYNNNYRPIYHLESIIYYMINKLYHNE